MGEKSEAPIEIGLLVSVAIAVVAIALNSVVRFISPLLWSFIISIVIINVLGKLPRSWEPGVYFASTTLLRGTIAALGFIITADIWLKVGWGAVAAIATIVIGLAAGYYFAYKIGPRLGLLVGIGTGICGATAIASTGPALRARPEEMGVAVAVITLFGLAAMFLYPALYPLVEPLLGPGGFAVWAGSGIHETAQVIGAAAQVSDKVADAALLVKAIRIFMIGPGILLVLWMFNRVVSRLGERGRTELGRAKLTPPIWAIMFIVASLVGTALSYIDATTESTGIALVDRWNSEIQPALSHILKGFLLAVAFAAVGLRVNLRDIARIGPRAFIAGTVLAVVASAVAFLVTWALVEAGLVSREL